MLRSIGVSLAIALLLPTMAHATTWYMKPVAAGSGDCSSWTNACASLATAKGKVASNTDQIWIMKGLYKFSTQVYNDQTSKYVLKIYGGFAGTETDLDFRDPVKNEVVFSADTANDDIGKTTAGVTPTYANVGSSATERLLAFFNTGVLESSPVNVLDGVTISGMNLKGIWSGGVLVYNAKALINNVKFIGNKGHAPAVQVSQPFSVATITNTEFTNNYSVDDTVSADLEINEGAAIYVESASAVVNCELCNFTGNRAKNTGGAVRVMSGANATIKLSAFTANVSETGAGGALNTDSSGIVNLQSVLFDSNIATASNGGAIAATAGTLNVISTTFFANNAGNGGGKSGGAINLGSGTALATIKYSTFVNNLATGTGSKGGAINVNAGYTSNLKPTIQASMFLNNTAVTGSNISDMASVVDGGYNIVGYNNISGAVTGASVYNFTSTSKTAAEPTLTNIIETSLKQNGGSFPSLKLAVGSMAINAIPNDVPAPGLGTTPTNPFTSIAQARGAMESYTSYDAGRYFFNINGTAFATYVDDEGYVLVASSDSANLEAKNYTKVSTLALRSDSILNDAIVAKFTSSEITEVRISSDSNGTRGTFDAISTDPDVINNLRQYLTLNNPGSGGAWDVRYSSKAVNYMTGTSWAGTTLDAEIYRANGAAGIFWIPSIPKEALLDPGSNQATIQDNLDLWVRSSKGLCNGTVAVDQRGLQRSDFVNPDDPNQYGLITACDIGSFEWNNGYQVDCWNEDGLRPENSISGGTASICFSDPKSVSPKSLINNFGSTDQGMLIFLAILGLWRVRRKSFH